MKKSWEVVVKASQKQEEFLHSKSVVENEQTRHHLNVEKVDAAVGAMVAVYGDDRLGCGEAGIVADLNLLINCLYIVNLAFELLIILQMIRLHSFVASHYTLRKLVQNPCLLKKCPTNCQTHCCHFHCCYLYSAAVVVVVAAADVVVEVVVMVSWMMLLLCYSVRMSFCCKSTQFALSVISRNVFWKSPFSYFFIGNSDQVNCCFYFNF
ncbi:predicted protein [Lodderomyces elongisporus NRRL YB-4239]|uniref:Uncharacterized protein n=1 Tax=Lodderomyces elongisporus (strain ATCC 11503 / CBS 2605 / JCM 1781 / NBRC 1676 / NRRL YB-4239) TaxID=379508 RepID=A5H2R5_LODEL|nr:predicted protein [Lodderomyces elongisporus NRRL YB-4239]